MKTLFRPRFWRDVEDGVSYLATHASVQTATRWHQAVLNTVSRIQKQPTLGRVRRDLNPSDIRSIRVKGYQRYLLFYRVHAGAVEILRVKHGMMNLPALFPPPEPNPEK